MNEINEEIKLTLNLMQAEVDGTGASNELQYHLMSLLEIKRVRLVAETELQAELERERERRFDGNRIASAEHRDELECLVSALEKIADFKLLSNDGATEFSISQDRWRKFCEAQGIAASAIAQYRKEPITPDQDPYKSVKIDGQVADEAKPLTADELMAGGWWCGDTSEDSLKAFILFGLKDGEYEPWDGSYYACFLYESGCKLIDRGYKDHPEGLKRIHRIGNDFYWCE